MDKQKLAKQISIVFVCILLGFAVSVQMKSVRVGNLSQSSAVRNEELQKMLTAEKERTASLQDQINQMQDTIDNYRTSIEQTGSAFSGLEAELENAENLAGLTDVYGPGVEVTLTDAKAPDGAIASEFILHDADVRSVVNELLAAGAEAISINGERVVSTTAIRCVGPVILVNDVRSNIPFVIKAIGDPAVLENALNMNGGIISELRSWNFGVDIKKLDKIEMAAYTGKVRFRFVTPVKKQEETVASN